MKAHQITDDLEKLLEVLPPTVQKALTNNTNKQDELIEVILDLGRLPEARYPNSVSTLGSEYLTIHDLETTIKKIGKFGLDNRAGIERTLHRISAIRNRQQDVVGLTCRVGRAVFGTVAMVRDLIESGQSLLLMGRPGVGKTTVLREIARVMADDLHKRVVVIDTSNEIAGDGDIPHPAIGRARRMQVAHPDNQHQVMIEAVENHMPEVIVIDEIGTELETHAARTIAERGVQLIATAHGNTLSNLIKNPTLSDLVGGIQSVTLGDEEARKRRTQKTVLERAAEPTFPIAVEINSRSCWSIHQDVARTVDLLLRGQPAKPQERSFDNDGKVKLLNINNVATKLERPIPNKLEKNQLNKKASRELITTYNDLIDYQLKSSDHSLVADESKKFLQVLCCGVSSQIIDEAIRQHAWPVRQVSSINEADVIITVRNGLSQNQSLRREARTLQVPILVIKSNTLHQIERAIKRLLIRHKGQSQLAYSQNFHNAQDDEVAALEECRLALEQVVVPLGRPIELLPRNMKVLQIQADLVHRYRLRCDIFGDADEQRLRVYPP